MPDNEMYKPMVVGGIEVATHKNSQIVKDWNIVKHTSSR